MSRVTLVYITNPSRAAAVKLARQLLSRRLIACANIHRSRSLYHWRGKLVDETEYILVGKTLPANVPTLRQAVRALHPYQVPCLLTFTAEANAAYAAWVRGEVP